MGVGAVQFGEHVRNEDHARLSMRGHLASHHIPHTESKCSDLVVQHEAQPGLALKSYLVRCESVSSAH